MQPDLAKHTSNDERYQQAAFNRPSSYPIEQTLSPEQYRPVAAWMGRLILPTPEQRSTVKGVLFEVHHAPAPYCDLVGQTVKLRWSDDAKLQAWVREVTRNIDFSQDVAESVAAGRVHPERLNHMPSVDPLESLAGAHPNDDVLVALSEPIAVDEAACVLSIAREPTQITGRYYALVTFHGPAEDQSDWFRVTHFNRATKQFDGAQEIVHMPQVIADRHGIFPSVHRGIEHSPLNASGWYIYGTQDRRGAFVVQALAPRALFQLQPDQVVFGQAAGWQYIRNESWRNTPQHKGTVSSVLCSPDTDRAIAEWREGDTALVVYTYSGIGGKKREPGMVAGISWGHFAFGTARVIHEPLADELVFAIEYQQVYTHNPDGIVAGTVSWARFMGDRQYGWLGSRPACDLLIKLDAFTEGYDLGGGHFSALDLLAHTLATMAARYRTGDGTGGTFVTLAHNCVQDSMQMFSAMLEALEATCNSHAQLGPLTQRNPQQAERLMRLLKLGRALEQRISPFSMAKRKWQQDALDDGSLATQLRGLLRWHILLPRMASDTLAKLFLEHGAAIWVLRTNQVGGYDPDIEPVTLFP